MALGGLYKTAELFTRTPNKELLCSGHYTGQQLYSCVCGLREDSSCSRVCEQCWTGINL